MATHDHAPSSNPDHSLQAELALEWRGVVERQSSLQSRLFKKLDDENQALFLDRVHTLVDKTMSLGRRTVFSSPRHAMEQAGAEGLITEWNKPLSESWGTKPQAVAPALRKATVNVLKVLVNPQFISITQLLRYEKRVERIREPIRSGRTHSTNTVAPPSTFHNSLRRKP